MRLGKRERAALKLDQAARKAKAIRSARVEDYAKPQTRIGKAFGPKDPASNAASLWPKGQMSLQWGHKRRWGGKTTIYA